VSAITKILSNGSGMVLPLEALFDKLSSTPLDPRFEAYGNFITAEPKVGRRDEEGNFVDSGKLCYPDIPGATEFWGNFFLVSHVFRVVTNDADLVARLTEAVRANQQTAEYGEACAAVAGKRAGMLS